MKKTLIAFVSATVAFLGLTSRRAIGATKISLEQATAIALKNVPGTIKSSEFEHEKGQDVFSFDIIGNDKAIHEILVNADSGKIVSSTIETAAKEAQEAKDDKAKKKENEVKE